MSKLGKLSTQVDHCIKAFNKSIGKTIDGITVTDNDLTVDFSDGSTLTMWDNGQQCCEHRYMNCDDDVGYYIGATLVDGEVSDGNSSPYDDNDNITDCEFLKIHTSKGVFTIANYNEHNGYYGGFDVASKLATLSDRLNNSIGE